MFQSNLVFASFWEYAAKCWNKINRKGQFSGVLCLLELVVERPVIYLLFWVALQCTAPAQNRSHMWWLRLPTSLGQKPSEKFPHLSQKNLDTEWICHSIQCRLLLSKDTPLSVEIATRSLDNLVINVTVWQFGSHQCQQSRQRSDVTGLELAHYRKQSQMPCCDVDDDDDVDEDDSDVGEDDNADVDKSVHLRFWDKCANPLKISRKYITTNIESLNLRRQCCLC